VNFNISININGNGPAAFPLYRRTKTFIKKRDQESLIDEEIESGCSENDR